MTNALVGYIIGKYASDYGIYADFNEILGEWCSMDYFHTPEVERFLTIQRFISRQNLTANKDTSALQLELEPLFMQLPEEDLPFYFLPLAYLHGATLDSVLRVASFLVTRLTTNSHTIDQVLCLVSAVKWSLVTQSSYYPFVYRCFPSVIDPHQSVTTIVGEALCPIWGDIPKTETRSETPVQAMLRKACEEPTHAAVRCALVYALAEVHASNTYSPVLSQPSFSSGTIGTKRDSQNGTVTLMEDFSQPFPLRPRLTSHVDAHIVYGYYRLDGYIAWQMKSQKEPMLDGTILGDENGPDRDELRFWNFCNKHLDWNQLAHELDQYFSIRAFLRVDWRDKFVRHEIQWGRQRVAFVLDNDRCLSFVPDATKKIFVLDKSEAKDAGISRFRFGTRPAIQVLENLSDKLMGDDDDNS